MPSIADKLGLMSAAETAARLKISTDTLKKLVAQERIPYAATPLGKLFVESEIIEYAKTFVPPRRGRPPKHKRRRRTRVGVATGERSASGHAGPFEQTMGGEIR
jgi:hypothetical protein